MGGLDGIGMRYRSEDFEVDGALRDVCILDASIDDWQNLLEGLISADWSVQFAWTLFESTDGAIPDARSLFNRLESDPEESASLAVQVGDIWFTCYFFDIDEIEFTFDPADVEDPASFAHLEAFVRRLGDSTHRNVVVTMEGTDHRAMPALIEYSPM
ncbi:hypothetical protein [Streptomyces sp. NBC_01443]|uniref:hypothetical protein n=1 Tax=Streptomyces sp. NBC_01443 TaxID=2903868 RepID=UPI002257F58B|nr:hypothetical protein [Streptomyces sp. NBC_01443]MCX4626779.1 hypothetical protein [Streptomyces sp. NBC_01443]